LNYKQIPKEYFTNLFVLWGLSILILGNFNSTQAIKWFLNKLWMTHLNLIIFSIIFCVVVYFSIRTIFKNKPLLSRIQKNHRFKIFITVYLAILLSVEIAPYFTGIVNVMAEENNIVSCACYPQLINTVQILDFVIIPFLYVIFFHQIKNVENVDKLIEKLNKIKVDWQKVLAKGYSNENFGKSKENIGPEIDYYRDTSITKEKDDQFKHIDYVKVLKDILLRSETPINIGLYGRWGVGKSSILSMLKEQIEKPDLSQQFRYLYVDTWKLSPQTLKQEVLVELNTQLESFTTSQIEDRLYNVKQEMYFDKSIIKAGWPLLIILGGGILGYLLYAQQTAALLAVIGISSVISVVSILIQSMINPSKRIISQAVSSHQFDILYEEMIHKEGKRKLAVVIDNLDRCNDEVAVELLGLIQSFMTKKNCINILACDDEAIINHLRQVKGESYTDKEGNEFLSKFFQVTIRIPPFIPENLDSYVAGLMEKRHNIPFHPSVKPVLISGAVKNPRKVNQFLNNLVALYRLADLKEEGGKGLPPQSITKRTDFLTKIIILHHEWPKFYDELDKVQDPRLLDSKSEEFTNWFSKTAEKPEQNEYEEQQFDGLKDFLTDTRYCRIDDIKPFLRLNQPSYEGEIQDVVNFANNVRGNRTMSILDTLNQADEKGKEDHIKKMRDINDQYEKEGTFDGLLNSTQAMISACEVITSQSAREIALRNLGKCISSDLMKTHLAEYDLDKLFPLIKEMPPFFADILYRNFIGYAETGTVLNEKLIAKILENSSTIPIYILDEYDTIITNLSTKYEEKILDIIMKNCNFASWNNNKFTKPTQFIISLINKIIFDDSPLDDKRIDTYLAIQNFIDSSERKSLINHLHEIVDKFTNPPALLPSKVLEITESFNEELVRGIHASVNNLFDSLTVTTTSMPDVNQRKRIFEILFKLIDITKGDTE
jgi:hypothetical protein